MKKILIIIILIILLIVFYGKFIEPKSLIPMEQQFIDFLTNNKDNYNGAIIRPLCQLNDKTFEAFKQFCERTRVVLLNENLTSNQYELIKNNPPIFVSSDFKNGGMKIANMINRLSYILGSNYTDILICDGPNNNVPAITVLIMSRKLGSGQFSISMPGIGVKF